MILKFKNKDYTVQSYFGQYSSFLSSKFKLEKDNSEYFCKRIVLPVSPELLKSKTSSKAFINNYLNNFPNLNTYDALNTLINEKSIITSIKTKYSIGSETKREEIIDKYIEYLFSEEFKNKKKEVIKLSYWLLRAFRSEVRMLKKLKNKEFAPLLIDYSNITESYSSDVCIITKYIEGQSLSEIINNNNLNFEKKISLFIKIIKAYHDLHACNILHIDIKPSNIMVTKDGIKILDYGISMFNQNRNMQDLVNPHTGTPVFRSPELRNKKPSEQSEIYSLGILLYLLITGENTDKIKLILDSNIQEETQYNKIQQYCKNELLKIFISSKLMNIILKSIEFNKELRYQNTYKMLKDIERLT